MDRQFIKFTVKNIHGHWRIYFETVTPTPLEMLDIRHNRAVYDRNAGHFDTLPHASNEIIDILTEKGAF